MRISDWSSDVCSSDLLAQAGEGWGGHVGQSFAGTEAGNQRRPNQKATLTSRISTGTSTSGPMTAAKATGDARPKAAMATAIASRSEERRGGKEGVSTGRARCSPRHEKKKK